MNKVIQIKININMNIQAYIQKHTHIQVPILILKVHINKNIYVCRHLSIHVRIYNDIYKYINMHIYI